MLTFSAGLRLCLGMLIVLILGLTILFISPCPAAAFAPGDVNGDGRIDVRDVVLAMQHALGLKKLTGAQFLAADITGDGAINVRDVTKMMQFSLGIIDDLAAGFKLGSEVLMEKERHLVQGKRVGLVTNQSGVNRNGISTIDVLNRADDVFLVALYGPEHGIDGTARAGEYVESYTHEKLKIPVYSLYGATRMPTEEMLKDIDVLLFDVQDIGARSYTYISTLNYCMVAGEKYGVPIIVLDRPNPLGGLIVEGPMLEERFKSFVGVDILPMAHGMTVGEIARYFNRNIGADLTVVAMEGYNRSMAYEETGLSWVQTSPNIPDLAAVYGYLITGLGEGTGVFQADQFKWIGGKGLDEHEYARLLNSAGLPGIEFLPEKRGDAGGVRLKITDPSILNPGRTGIYALTYAFQLGDFNIPKSTETSNVMFDLIMGTGKMGLYLEQGFEPEEIVRLFNPAVEDFKKLRRQYLLPQYGPF